MADPTKAGFGKRVHAWLLAHGTARYERMVAERKRALLSGLGGNILEIGPGTGPNLQFYSKDCRWIGVEPNPYMVPYLRQRAKQAGLHIEIRSGTAEQLPAADQSIDAVVATLVLCSVTDPEQVLREVQRVLEPGGRFLFIEHVAAPPGTRLRTAQHWLGPLWKRIADGCHPDRETGRLIEQAGFTEVRYEEFRLPLGPVGPQIAGGARKP
jgi:ubiquinone/menaquinone biosynthesis C-methylase UbiE